MILFMSINSEKDKSKMEQIWEVHRTTMLKTAYRILGKHCDAECAAQESCEKIIRNLSKIKEISSCETRAYIVSIVRNTSLDILRKGKREMDRHDELHENIPSEDISIPDSLIGGERYEAIMEAIENLPDHLKDVIYLCLVHNHSHKEVAELLSITEANSRMRLTRAKRKIIKRLGGEGYDK